jgi:peptidoglycan/LPS O-acetylase OafA/YrhL
MEVLIIFLFSTVLIRLVIHHTLGEIQSLSYWTIVGRIDQFLLGILAFQFRESIAGKHFLAISSLFAFACFYYYFDSQGGFYETLSYPSPSSIWIYMPTIEGLSFAILIAWYDNSFTHSTGKLSKFFALVGTYSYSIYLLHFFIVFGMSKLIHLYIIDLSNIYLAMLISIPCFLIMIPIGHINYTYAEQPFLRYRKK